MAKAPVPGRAREDEAAQLTIRMTMSGRTLSVQPAALSLKERFVLRSATGLPFEAFFSGGELAIGEDSVAVLWWLARRSNGEPNLPFEQFQGEWHLDPDDFEIAVDEPDDEDDSPEG